MVDFGAGASFYWGALTQLVSGIAISASAARTSAELASKMQYPMKAQPLPRGGKIPDNTPAYYAFTPSLAPNAVLNRARADRDVAAFASGLAMLALPSLVAFVDSVLVAAGIVFLLLVITLLGTWLIRRSAYKALTKSALIPGGEDAPKSITWRPSVTTWLMILANLIVGTLVAFLRQ